jgi:HEAT repeat protein
MDHHDSHPETDEHLVLLGSSDAGLQQNARDWFLSRGQDALSDLARALKTPGLGSTIHWQILRLLPAIDPEYATPLVMEALERSLDGQQPSLTTGAIEALGTLNTEASVRRLIELTRHTNEDIAKHAVIVLGALHPPQAIEALTPLLRTADPSLRYTVVGALIEYPDEEIKRLLRTHAEHETDSDIQTLMKRNGVL